MQNGFTGRIKLFIGRTFTREKAIMTDDQPSVILEGLKKILPRNCTSGQYLDLAMFTVEQCVMEVARRYGVASDSMEGLAIRMAIFSGQYYVSPSLHNSVCSCQEVSQGKWTNKDWVREKNSRHIGGLPPEKRPAVRGRIHYYAVLGGSAKYPTVIVHFKRREHFVGRIDHDPREFHWSGVIFSSNGDPIKLKRCYDFNEAVELMLSELEIPHEVHCPLVQREVESFGEGIFS